jgi:5-methylcytosine-specific restriction endonuclease McrA
MSARRRPYVGLYGNTAIAKERCSDCDRFALVINGRLACCDRKAQSIPEFLKRETCPGDEKRIPSPAAQREQLDRQGDRCMYCERQFGGYAFKGVRAMKLRVCWDHVVPFAFGQDNSDVNFVAACQICNGIKSTRLYPSLDSARIDIMQKREELGFV